MNGRIEKEAVGEGKAFYFLSPFPAYFSSKPRLKESREEPAWGEAFFSSWAQKGAEGGLSFSGIISFSELLQL